MVPPEGKVGNEEGVKRDEIKKLDWKVLEVKSNHDSSSWILQ
jgi:hypothetical protein